MTNAFNWKEFTEEERAKRGDLLRTIKIAQKISDSSMKLVEKKRMTNRAYGTLEGVTAKPNLTPKKFAVYSKAVPSDWE